VEIQGVEMLTLTGGLYCVGFINLLVLLLVSTKDRLDLPSEKAHKRDRTVTVKQLTNIWSLAPDGARHQDILTDRPSVVN
jgi:hypothetical protein